MDNDDAQEVDDDVVFLSISKPISKPSSMPSSKPVKRLKKRTPLPINNNDDDDVEEVDHDGNLVARLSTAVKVISPDVRRIAVSLQTIRFAITIIDSLTNLSILY